MASGNTLVTFGPLQAEPPSTNFAALSLRNQHPVLAFDATTAETVYFSGVMPRHYAGGGITLYTHWAAATATSGTIGWLAALERIGDGSQDLDADGWAADQTITAATVPGTAGLVDITSVAISAGAATDSIAAGEAFRLRITRDVANDTAAGDAHLVGIELKET